jgi:hypothetical protein
MGKLPRQRGVGQLYTNPPVPISVCSNRTISTFVLDFNPVPGQSSKAQVTPLWTMVETTMRKRQRRGALDGPTRKKENDKVRRVTLGTLVGTTTASLLGQVVLCGGDVRSLRRQMQQSETKIKGAPLRMAQSQKQKEFVASFHRTCVVLTLPSSAIDATGPRIGVVGGGDSVLWWY